MNKYETKALLQPNRHILAIASGIVGGALPNYNSNIHPYITGAIVAGFIVKYIYGDYDVGYQWSFSDLIFWTITLLEGALGAFIINQFVSK